MPAIRRSALTLLFCLAWPGTAPANPAVRATWDQEAALHAAHAQATDAVSERLVALTVAGSTEEALELLQSTQARGDWPEPAREKALYEYAQALRALPSAAVPPQIIAWLKAYQPLTLVPHEDHPDAAVPLYNIRGAAHGVENAWRQQDGLAEGLALLAISPGSLVDAWLLEAHPAARYGYLDALERATPGQLDGLGEAVLGRLDQHPGLTELGAQAALLSGDLPRLQAVLAAGDSAALGPVLSQAAATLPAPDAAELMESLLRTGTPAGGGLAIATLAPAAAGEPGVQALLIEQLGDPRLGGAAALALARIADAGTLNALAELASSHASTPAGQRARLALSLHAELPTLEARR